MYYVYIIILYRKQISVWEVIVVKKVKIRKAKKQDVDTVAHLIYYTEVKPHDV